MSDTRRNRSISDHFGDVPKGHEDDPFCCHCGEPLDAHESTFRDGYPPELHAEQNRRFAALAASASTTDQPLHASGATS